MSAEKNVENVAMTAVIIAALALVAFVISNVRACTVQLPVECAKACGERGVHSVHSSVCECK